MNSYDIEKISKNTGKSITEIKSFLGIEISPKDKLKEKYLKTSKLEKKTGLLKKILLETNSVNELNELLRNTKEYELREKIEKERNKLSVDQFNNCSTLQGMINILRPMFYTDAEIDYNSLNKKYKEEVNKINSIKELQKILFFLSHPGGNADSLIGKRWDQIILEKIEKTDNFENLKELYINSSSYENSKSKGIVFDKFLKSISKIDEAKQAYKLECLNLFQDHKKKIFLKIVELSKK